MFVEAAVEGEDTQALFILEVLDNGLIMLQQEHYLVLSGFSC